MKMFYNDKAYSKTDLTDPYIWWHTFFIQMEARLMKVEQCLNRSWAHNSYFILRRSTV